MGIFSERLPTRRETILGFAVCVFLVFSWSILIFFKKIPYWILFLSLWDLISALAYALAFALVESMVILLVWIFVSAVLPAQLLRRRFVALGSIVILVSAAWVAADHLNLIVFLSSPLWPLLYAISVAIFYLLVYRFQTLEKVINSFVERLTVLLYIYIPAALLGGMFVILRNLGSLE